MLKNIFLVKDLANPRNQRTFAVANKKHRGVEQLVARQAHNLEVARSSRTPATKKKPNGFFFFVMKIIKCHKKCLLTPCFDNLYFTK